MSNAIPSQSFWDKAVDATKHFLGSSEVPETIRADAANFHRYVKKVGGIWVELNPIRDNQCWAAYSEIKKTRDDKVNNAGAVREAKLKEAKARYDEAVAAIEKEHRETAAVATKEFETAEQKLLEGFSARPVIEQGATS